MSLEDAKQFVARFVTGDFSPEEKRDFLRWLIEAKENEMEVVADLYEFKEPEWVFVAQRPSESWIASLESKLDKASRKEAEALVIPLDTRRRVRRRVWVAAASVAVLLSAGTYFFVQEKGRQEVGGAAGQVAVSNTYYNGRGSIIKPLSLPDGTKVWLNSASSLKYGMGKERIVELSGEAFFQVAPDSEHPFRVKIKDAEVEVLGTDFNVMAYEDDQYSKTTLIRGSVRMESGSQQVLLKPGEQAEVSYLADGGVAAIKVKDGVSVKTVSSWKDGIIPFQDETVRSILRKVSRYYNVDIEVKPDVPDTRLSGSLSGSNGLDKILKQLEGYLNIHCVTNGKTVTVSI